MAPNPPATQGLWKCRSLLPQLPQAHPALAEGISVTSHFSKIRHTPLVSCFSHVDLGPWQEAWFAIPSARIPLPSFADLVNPPPLRYCVVIISPRELSLSSLLKADLLYNPSTGPSSSLSHWDFACVHNCLITLSSMKSVSIHCDILRAWAHSWGSVNIGWVDSG